MASKADSDTRGTAVEIATSGVDVAVAKATREIREQLKAMRRRNRSIRLQLASDEAVRSRGPLAELLRSIV